MPPRGTKEDADKIRLNVYRLRDRYGMSYGKIAKELGIKKAMVQYYLGTRGKAEENTAKSDVMSLW